MLDQRPVTALLTIIAVLLTLNLILIASGSVRADPPAGCLYGCCLPDTGCVDLDPIECIANDGVPQSRLCGESKRCGACYTPTGCVDRVIEAICTEDLGGNFAGEGTECELLLPGACCRPDGSCDRQPLESLCTSTGGVFHGGVPCDFVDCDPCIGDCNRDGDVGFADVLDVLRNWGPCS